MARPRSFDEPDALEAAIDCFWDRGYETTSIRDLTERMGVSAPSLYNAFGDKRRLFVLALERYADCRMRERIGRLEETCSPKVAIVTFFEELISRSLSDKERRGCLIVNSALEVAPHDQELREIVASYLSPGDMKILKEQGAFVERINYKERVFIPTAQESTFETSLEGWRPRSGTVGLFVFRAFLKGTGRLKSPARR